MPTSPLSFAEFSELVHARRTSMQHDKMRAVDPATIDALCELAIWAPNHKLTFPWRFAAFTGAARAQLGQAFVADLREASSGDEAAADERKLAKTATKYTRAPAILVVGCSPDADPGLNAENRDAVAAGVQNILLGSTALGMNSYWSTAPVMQGSNALALCGFAPDDRIIAVIYLGWAEAGRAGSEPPARPATTVRHLS